jgi:hypothetical protein
VSETKERKQLLLAFPHWSNPDFAQVRFFTDISTRITACHECNKPIPKRRRRVVLVVRRARTQKLPNGAIISKDTLFFHPNCITNAFKFRGERGHRCVDCRKPADSATQGYMNQRHIFGRLCERCLLSGRWLKCHYCNIAYPAYMIERVNYSRTDFHFYDVDEGKTEACRFCVDRLDLYTVAMQKKDDKFFGSYRRRLVKTVKGA